MINIEPPPEPCPECGKLDEYWVDEQLEIITCVCGAIISKPVYH